MAGTVSRRQLIGLGGGAAAALALSSCGEDSASADSETERFGEGDAGLLNYLLLLEHVAVAFYEQAAASGLFAGRQQRIIEQFKSQEREHVSALTKALERHEAKPLAEPRTSFPQGDANATLALAAGLENTTAAAYLGQVPHAESKEALAVLLSIHSVEGSHASALAIFLGQPFTPDGPFAKPVPARSVLKEVGAYVSGGIP
jgi:rubrerythrin